MCLWEEVSSISSYSMILITLPHVIFNLLLFKLTTDWFQIGKGVHQGCILSLCLFILYAVYIMRNTGLEEAQAGI